MTPLHYTKMPHINIEETKIMIQLFPYQLYEMKSGHYYLREERREIAKIDCDHIEFQELLKFNQSLINDRKNKLNKTKDIREKIKKRKKQIIC